MNHGHIVTTTMRSTAKAKAIAPTRKRNQWLLVAAAGVFIATVLYITRPAHGDSVRIVGFLPQVQRSVKAEPTVIDYTSMTATLATATPQPPMGVL